MWQQARIDNDDVYQRVSKQYINYEIPHNEHTGPHYVNCRLSAADWSALK